MCTLFDFTVAFATFVCLDQDLSFVLETLQSDPFPEALVKEQCRDGLVKIGTEFRNVLEQPLENCDVDSAS